MVNYDRGMIAGLKSGVIFGFIWAIFDYINPLYHPYFSYSNLLFSFIYRILFGFLIGLILGLFFAGLYNKIPGTSSNIKGMVFFTFIWFIFTFLPYSFLSSYGKTAYGNYQMMATLISLVFFGYFIGLFWDRYTQPELLNIDGNNYKLIKCSNCDRHIPNDANICPYCGIKIK